MRSSQQPNGQAPFACDFAHSCSPFFDDISHKAFLTAFPWCDRFPGSARSPWSHLAKESGAAQLLTGTRDPLLPRFAAREDQRQKWLAISYGLRSGRLAASLTVAMGMMRLLARLQHLDRRGSQPGRIDP